MHGISAGQRRNRAAALPTVAEARAALRGRRRPSVEGFSNRRVELVQRAVKEWVGALIDLGGRNNLLRYRDLRAGTLDLTSANSSAVAALLEGKSIKTSSLFLDAEERERNLRRLRT